jgi:glyoxylase-like metal-dependent hydrolase (beta-lactamase superfamily II)
MERARVGDAEIISLTDCAIGMPAEQMYPEAGSRLDGYRHLLTEDGQASMQVHCFLIRADGRAVLVDTGMGPEAGGALLTELRSAGAEPKDVDFVVFTHLHGDHTGWNLERESGRPRFGAARYLVSRAEWEHCRASTPESASFRRDLAPLEALGCLDLVLGGHRITPSVATVATPGHTPGHLCIEINSRGQRGCILGDLVFTLADVAEPGWRVVFDGDHAAAVRTRLAALDRLESERSLVGATHLPGSGLGRFLSVEGRHSWRPLGA